MEYDFLYIKEEDDTLISIPVIRYEYLQQLIQDHFPKVAHHYKSLGNTDSYCAYGCFYTYYVHRLTDNALDKNKYNSILSTVNRGCAVPFSNMLSLLAHRGVLSFKAALWESWRSEPIKSAEVWLSAYHQRPVRARYLIVGETTGYIFGYDYE